MNQEKLREQVHAGIDRHCAPLTADPYRVQRVLAAARPKGERIVKKKLSVTLILAIAMVVLTSTALAVATIWETGRFFAQTEQEMGDYIAWPAEKKASVVCALMDEGYIAETAERRQLRDGLLTPEDAARVADAAIAEFTGEDAQDASFLSIMSAAWGPFENWTQEQKAWYSQVKQDVGASMDGKTVYVEADAALTAQDAAAIAKREIARGLGMDASVLDKYRVVETSLQIPEFAEPGDTKAWWYVALDASGTELEGRDDLPFHAMDVFVDPDTGALLVPVEEKAAVLRAAEEQRQHPLAVAIREFEASVNEPKAFHTWSVAHKARWSQEIAPQIRAYIADNGDAAFLALGNEMKLAVDFVYGLPGDDVMAQEQALSIAEDALAAAYDLSNEEMSLLTDNGLPFDEPAAFYDVTNPEQPLWKFLFTMPSVYCADDTIAARVKALYGTETNHNQCYLVELDAKTGAVLRTLAAMSLPSLLADF